MKSAAALSSVDFFLAEPLVHQLEVAPASSSRPRGDLLRAVPSSKAAIARHATCPRQASSPPPPGPSVGGDRSLGLKQLARPLVNGQQQASPGRRRAARGAASISPAAALDQPLVVGGELLDTRLALGDLFAAIAAGEPRRSAWARPVRSAGASASRPAGVKRLQFHEHLLSALTLSLSATTRRHPLPDARTERSRGPRWFETFSGSTRHLGADHQQRRSPRRRREWERSSLEHGPTAPR